MGSVVLATTGPVQHVAVIIVAVIGLTFAITARILTRRVIRQNSDDARQNSDDARRNGGAARRDGDAAPTSPPDDLEPGQY
ncbi:hypothetical protein [Curtobacterium sp. PhB115]|uniref:hypothetical protein n=1 Tax=Curtobacterium sp. PhB115 TaxID=2485173 RepID=UPI0011CDF6B1|nr:hypothetical protein [Curtobacterium sp. PhB115]